MNSKKSPQDTFLYSWLNQTRNKSYENYWKASFTDIDLILLECGYEKCNPGEYWGPGCKERYVLHYILSGSGILTVKGVEHFITAGDVFMIMKNDTVYYKSSDTDPLEYRWIGFSGIKAPHILQKTCFTTETPICHNMGRDGFFCSALRDIYHSTKKQSVSDLELIGKLYLFLDGLILRCPNPINDTVLNTEQDYVQRCIRYIHMNYSSDCQVNVMAKELGLSRSYLFKLFKKNLGISPSTYIQDLRMHLANSLLEKKVYSVEEIANSVGYNDPAYFAKIYRQYYNVPPTQLQND